MSQVTRRHAFRVMAAGAVLSSGAAAAQGDEFLGSSARENASGLPEEVFKISSAAIRRTGCAVQLHEATALRKAQVAHCRSWDSTIYLYVDDTLKGFVQVNAQGFAIAAACQAAGRKISVRYWGHDPYWSNGAGRFDGALLALDPRDIPTDPWVASCLL